MSRSRVFIAELEHGTLAQALPDDLEHARSVLHRLLPELPPVKTAYVVPNSSIREVP